jgi:hypothetical protein
MMSLVNYVVLAVLVLIAAPCRATELSFEGVNRTGVATTSAGSPAARAGVGQANRAPATDRSKAKTRVGAGSFAAVVGSVAGLYVGAAFLSSLPALLAAAVPVAVLAAAAGQYVATGKVSWSEAIAAGAVAVPMTALGVFLGAGPLTLVPSLLATSLVTAITGAITEELTQDAAIGR